MSTITFRCPGTRQYVQQLIAEEAEADRNAYVMVDCPACGKLHFINRSTQKLLGHERE
jgi:phage FluMu protein Com